LLRGKIKEVDVAIVIATTTTTSCGSRSCGRDSSGRRGCLAGSLLLLDVLRNTLQDVSPYSKQQQLWEEVRTVRRYSTALSLL
jgi:hypothetical protein